MPKPRSEVPDDLGIDDQKRLWAFCQSRYPHLSRGQVRGHVDECLAYWGAKGNPRSYHVWWLACKAWIVKAERWADQRKEARPEPREEFGESNVISLFKRA